MVFLRSALAAAVLAADTLAAPTSEIQKRGIRSEAHRYIPSHVNIAEDTGAVEAITDGGGWVLPVLIGGQQLFLNIDTGSSDLYVY
jgi:aspergillopepsin I